VTSRTGNRYFFDQLSTAHGYHNALN